MDAPRKHQVLLRGASAKEITRDDLLQKVSRERELRNYAKRAVAAALFIQIDSLVLDSVFMICSPVGYTSSFRESLGTMERLEPNVTPWL
ncbi:E3 ubiquitin-protein ligase [Sesbania bispinosa]|nr:E3 ubiquitin-protein ligase [Sesbania bispinosa]